VERVAGAEFARKCGASFVETSSLTKYGIDDLQHELVKLALQTELRRKKTAAGASEVKIDPKAEKETQCCN
jgi:hypothetical protein